MDQMAFEFDASIAAGCNGNAASDKPYIRWFCQEAIARAERAAMQIQNIAILRDWGEMDTVRGRLESSWALLRALSFTLDELACAARLKPEISGPFSEAAQSVSSKIGSLERDYERARSWFDAKWP